MVIVFVHGIFSSCEVFKVLKERIKVGCPSPLKFLDFEYPYLEPLADNAKKLDAFLRDEIGAGETVAIIAHSMGGLVSRMALLTGNQDYPFTIRFLIMLATPNHGAVKMSQIHGIAGMIRQTIGKVPALYNRSRGLDDLTRVNSIMRTLLGTQGGAIVNRTLGVDYVTIPALIFDADNPYQEDFVGSSTSRILNVIAFWNWKKGDLRLNYPHDGIVEEKSVRMVSVENTDPTERTRFSTDEGRAKLGRNANVHVIHPDLHSANHVEIHSIPRVCSLVVSLLCSNGIDDWKSKIGDSDRNVLVLSNGNLI